MVPYESVGFKCFVLLIIRLYSWACSFLHNSSRTLGFPGLNVCLALLSKGVSGSVLAYKSFFKRLNNFLILPQGTFLCWFSGSYWDSHPRQRGCHLLAQYPQPFLRVLYHFSYYKGRAHFFSWVIPTLTYTWNSCLSSNLECYLHHWALY